MIYHYAISKFRIISLYVILIFGITLIIGCKNPDVIEIKLDFFGTEEPVELISRCRPHNNLKVTKFVDKRTTEIVDTWYDQGHPQVYWIVKNDITDVITDAVRAELRNQGYLAVSSRSDFYLLGQIQNVKTKVVHRYPEIIEGNIQITAALKMAVNGDFIWKETITGRGVSEGKGHMRADQEEAINSAIANLIKNFLSIESFYKSMN